MICEKCGAEIDSLNVNTFDRFGADYWDEIIVEEFDVNAVVVDTDRNWTGYELSEEEMRDTIECPKCHMWPFESKEIQIYEYVRIVMFKKDDKGGKEIG